MISDDQIYYLTLQPFTLEVWAAIISLYLAANFLLTFISIKTNKSHKCFVFEDFLYIWGSYCRQSLPGNYFHSK